MTPWTRLLLIAALILVVLPMAGYLGYQLGLAWVLH